MGVSLRKLAKALGVGTTTIYFHFEGGVGAVSSAVAQQALAGVTRPFKPKEEPARRIVAPALLRLKPGEDEVAAPVVGVRHGHRERTLTGTFGKMRIAVPRARLTGADGKTSE